MVQSAVPLQGGGRPRPAGFNSATRLKRFQLPALSKTANAAQVTLRQDLPRVGLLSRIYLAISATVSGTLSNQNALGAASIINRVRLRANNAITIFDVSGPGYHYLLRDALEFEGYDPLSHTTARSAVSATTFVLDMVIPVAVNLRDPIGLILLQNEQTLLTLEVVCEADGTVATGASVTATVTPYMEVFTVPPDPQDWPPLDLVHQILEETQSVTGSADVTYQWPRGNTYLQVIHGAGIAQSGTDQWTAAKLRVNQSDYLENLTTGLADLNYTFTHGRARLKGQIYWDFMGSSGLGNYNLTRDLINSALVTDLATVITPSSLSTLYTIRRQLVPLNG